MATMGQIQTVPKPNREHLDTGVLDHVVLGLAMLLLWLVAPSVSAEVIVKCLSHTGEVIYSDVPCEKQGALPDGTINASPNGFGGTRFPQVGANQGTVPQAPPAPAAPTDGRLYVNGYIGDKPVRFLVDTGATEVSIPYKRAIELGIPVFAGQRGEGTTASGQVGIYRIRLASIAVGDVTVRNVAAHVSLNESGSQDILLGMSFLRHVTLVLRNGALTIGP
jgi:clan AA aspartic protease (TIGR02281 family)